MHQTPEAGPYLPSIVHRKRLHQRLDGLAAPGIVVVTAQAAQGKTTLIADYLKARGVRSGWMALRAEDTDPAFFRRHLVRVCHPFLATEDAKPAIERMLTEDTPRPTTECIAHLFKHLPADLSLVFDGWDRIASPARTVRRIKAIVAARPPQGCVYLISREDLPIELQRARIRRQALQIGDEDLAFSEDEIGVFFRTVNGLTLDSNHRRQILRITAGWAGGLVILAEELQRHAERAEELLSAPLMPEHLETEAGRYFGEEVYGRQPEAMQAFLARAALLDMVPAELLPARIGGRPTELLIAEACRQHLFIQVLSSPPNPWRFRINPLFRAFLRTQARKILSQDKIHQILIQAASDCEAQNEIELAATYYLQAEATAAAARAITTIGIEMTIEGRFDEIGPWTTRLPPATIRDDPWLGLLQATTFRIRGGRRTIDELQTAHAAFVQAKHARGQMFALAYLIETAVFVGYESKSLRHWITKGEKLLEKTCRLAHFTYAKALLWQQIGLGVLSQFDNDLQKGLSACENAVVLGKRIDAPSMVVNTLTIAAQGLARAGEFDQARERLEAAQAFGTGHRFPEYDALRALTEFYLALIDGQMPAAAGRLQQVQAAIDALGLISLYPIYLEATGMLQIHRKQYAALEKTRRHLHDVATLFNNSAYRAIGFWLAGLSCYHQEHFRRAQAVMRPGSDMPDLPLRFRARCLALMGFIALNLGQLPEAESYFQEACAFFEEHSLTVDACETHMGMALVKNAGQEVSAAERHLDVAFKTAASRRYETFPMVRPADLARACVLSIQLEIPAAVDYARHLLAHRLLEDEIQIMAAAEKVGRLAESMNTRETRRAIYRARIPTLFIQTLGGLQILRNRTDPLSTRAWQGSRPALLLKAILVHGGRHIPKDILIEALWPDRHPDHSLQNFKVTLHRLRKLLEPDLKPSQGSAYIHLKDNLVSLDKHLCEVDTDTLHRLCKLARRTDASADTQTLSDMYRQADALYQGDFLPEEPYLTWAEMKRTTLRQAFIQLMYRLGRCLQEQQEFSAARRCYRRIVGADPGQEKAQRRLMHLLDEAGRSQEALQSYQSFQTFLANEIGATPDQATAKLFRSIRNRLHPG